MTQILEKDTEFKLDEIRHIELEIQIPSEDGLIIEEKQAGEPEKIMTAIISSSSVDRVGDRVMPGAFVNLNRDGGRIPLLWAHDRSEFPLGKSISLRNDRKRGTVIGKFKFRGSVKAKEAWELVKEGYVSTVSVGFNVLKDGYERNDAGGWDIKKAELLEVSLVNIPANREAVIAGIKGLQDKGYQFSQATLKEFGFIEIEKSDGG